MLMLKAQVHDGRLRIDEPYDAPDGTEVDLAVLDEGDSLSEEERARLHEALRRSHEEMLRGDVVPAEDVLGKLRATRG